MTFNYDDVSHCEAVVGLVGEGSRAGGVADLESGTSVAEDPDGAGSNAHDES